MELLKYDPIHTNFLHAHVGKTVLLLNQEKTSVLNGAHEWPFITIKRL